MIDLFQFYVLKSLTRTPVRLLSIPFSSQARLAERFHFRTASYFVKTEGKKKKKSSLFLQIKISTSASGKYLACHLSCRPAGAPSEDKICVAVVAVGGTTGGVSEGELTGVQTGNRL